MDVAECTGVAAAAEAAASASIIIFIVILRIWVGQEARIAPGRRAIDLRADIDNPDFRQ
ncbi:hypothetical protein [Sphingomonas xanthus]|uniref:hypothetical protein n=1 Tax=Sphingomonas xanthus TaxID=2594473 RepID=UPI00164D0183|nr:hypothetical protein [Sphingomonas xanthus]